jgi:redox-sensitive bicupin YhaK (pirin superfamily)
MSWNPMSAHGGDALETLIIPRARDIGGFEVRRALPSAQRQMVGPFIFFDQVGPAEFVTGSGLDVRPHPHIGLGTVTYLYQGAFEHRDSTGAQQVISPGDVNWMIAGKGVTHSERTGPEVRAAGHGLFGVQTWIALPERDEDMDPSFEHHSKGALPVLRDGGASARVILGQAYGVKSPVTMPSEAFYLDVSLEAGTGVPLPDEHEDRGIFIMQGSIMVAGQSYDAGQMMVFRPGDGISVQAGSQGARLLVLGGATMNERRFIWWNFVSSSKEKIEAAKDAWKQADWDNGPFRLPPGDDQEFIAL